MKKRNGFVFVETMVTVVILSTALLVIYSLFNNILIKEHRKAYFDDPIYVYRTNYLTLIFEEIIKDASTTSVNPGEYVNFSELLATYENGVRRVSKLRMFTCNNDIFNKNPEAKARCQQFFIDNQIYRIYISTYDLSYIDECAMNNGSGPECNYYNSLNKQARLYFKQLPYLRNGEGYYVIFEFYDNGKDGVCSSEKCMHQFGSVKYGGLTNTVNLNTIPQSQERTYLLTNQVRNGSFESNFTGFNNNGVTSNTQYNFIASDNYRFGTKSSYRTPGSITNQNYLSQPQSFKKDHIYYYFLYANTPSTTPQSLKFDIHLKTGTLVDTTITSADGWQKFAVMYESTETDDSNISINFGANTDNLYIDGVGMVDLTQAFGAGNEPTLQWCNENIEYFDTATFITK